MQPHDLADFMNAVTSQIGTEYERIRKRASEDPGTAGDQGEENWATILRDWLPHTVHVVTKGRILSEKGIASPQVDVIVLQPEYPKHLLDKKLYLAGGVLAAFECKLTLKSQHISEFIRNSVEIKDHLPKTTGTPYKEIQGSLIYGLLAHSHSWKGSKSQPIETIQNKIEEFDRAFIHYPKQMPDLICVADTACWSSFKMSYMGPERMSVWNDAFKKSFGDSGSAQTMYMCHSGEESAIEINYSPIGALISLLVNKLAYRIPTLRSLAEYYTQTNIQGMGKGANRLWPIEIYSEAIRHKVRTGYNAGQERYSEWDVIFP